MTREARLPERGARLAPSVQPRLGRWQSAQLTAVSPLSRGSKKRSLPSSTFSGVCGLSAGIGGGPSGARRGDRRRRHRPRNRPGVPEASGLRGLGQGPQARRDRRRDALGGRDLLRCRSRHRRARRRPREIWQEPAGGDVVTAHRHGSLRWRPAASLLALGPLIWTCGQDGTTPPGGRPPGGASSGPATSLRALLKSSAHGAGFCYTPAPGAPRIGLWAAEPTAGSRWSSDLAEQPARCRPRFRSTEGGKQWPQETTWLA